MTAAEKIVSKYEIGLPIFLKLFNLKKDDLILKLKDILKDKLTENAFEALFNYNPFVEKITLNDEPDSIAVYFWDRLEITPMSGITYRAENRASSITLVNFDEYFKLD